MKVGISWGSSPSVQTPTWSTHCNHRFQSVFFKVQRQDFAWKRTQPCTVVFGSACPCSHVWIVPTTEKRPQLVLSFEWSPIFNLCCDGPQTPKIFCQKPTEKTEKFSDGQWMRKHLPQQWLYILMGRPFAWPLAPEIGPGLHSSTHLIDLNPGPNGWTPVEEGRIFASWIQAEPRLEDWLSQPHLNHLSQFRVLAIGNAHGHLNCRTRSEWQMVIGINHCPFADQHFVAENFHLMLDQR